MASIKQPGVEVSQEIISSSPTIITPSLNPVIVGPCYQIVKGVDDDNKVVSSSHLGSYAQGAGTVAYSLSSILKTGALIDEDSLQVYMSTPTVTRLAPPKDEEIVLSGTTDSYTHGTGILVDSSQDFTAEGVLTTDVVRLEFQGTNVDFPISEVSTGSDVTKLTLTDQISETLVAVSYQIIRNPAEFAYQSVASHSSVKFGDETDYLKISLKEGGTYAGAAGDACDLVIDYGYKTKTGTGGYSNGYLFFTEDAVLLSSLTASTDYLINVTDDEDFQIESVISDHALGLPSLITAGSSKNYSAGEALLTATESVNFSSTSTVSVSVSYTGNVTFMIADVAQYGSMSGTTLTNYGTDSTRVTPDSSRTGAEDITLIIKAEIEGTEGAKGTTKFAAADFITTGDNAFDNNDTVIMGSANASLSEAYGGSMSDKIAAASGLGDQRNAAYSVGLTSQTLALEMNQTGTQLTVKIGKSAGLATSTYDDVEQILTNSGTSGYSATIAAIYTATEYGSGGAFKDGATANGTDDASYDFDGGADADNIVLDADLLNGTTGTGHAYVSFKALRVDVSDQASSPELLSYSSITDMTAAIGPVSADNPLALGMYYAMLNAPNMTVKGVGISATSTSQTEGTTAAYTSALEFLESKDVYSMVPLSHDTEVLSAFESHVDSMSSASNKSERIAFFNRPFPSYTSATLLASGTAGSTTGTFTSDFLFSTAVDFSLVTDYTTALDAGEEIVLVVSGLTASDDAPRAAHGVDGGKYGIRVASTDSDTFKLSLNTTDVGEVGSGWDSLVDKTWSLYKIGSAISTTTAATTRVADLGGLYANRRVFLVYPGEFTASINGNASIIKGYYASAGWAGKVAFEKIGQGFTNMTLSGFTGVKKASDYFNKSQLDTIAGGGVFICMQDTDTSPVKCRHQLSTDVSTIQKRELSITKSVDYVAKYFREQLVGKIGVFNITNTFLDSLSAICQATLGYLVNTGVLKSGSLTDVSVDEDSPDTINITVLVEVYYPSNYILMTIQV